MVGSCRSGWVAPWHVGDIGIVDMCSVHVAIDRTERKWLWVGGSVILWRRCWGMWPELVENDSSNVFLGRPGV